MDPIHLLGLKDFDPDTILSIINTATQLSQNFSKSIPNLSQISVLNMFFENSSRTSLSFRLAQSQLGLITHDFTPKASSLSKGESLLDTLDTMEAIGFDMAVIRHTDETIFENLSEGREMSLINAGNGTREHPTQALLDLLTIIQEFGSVEKRKIAIIGDIHHSRVANSLIYGVDKLGGELLLSGPKELRKPNTQFQANIQFGEIDDIIPQADVVVMLRAQLERHQNIVFDKKTYNEQYGLNHERLKNMQEKTIIMHPGPFNRGIEITDEVVRSKRSRIFKQVKNGTIIRMAVMQWLAANRVKRGNL